ncbi:hypothetical protein ABFG93_16080 [Pseudalkalibacillus hwajinpoensis]|uniref:hypothetical protein n=1 Tax=Guptibacillus hwajinpoensis TaxID=208199 RepID=UPI00325A9CD5
MAEQEKKKEQKKQKSSDDVDEESLEMTESNSENTDTDANYPPVSLTREEAVQMVKVYASVPDHPNVHIDYSYDNDNGDWVYQVYEVVIDDPETKEGHTATWGWFAVDPEQGYVYDNFNY